MLLSSAAFLPDVARHAVVVVVVVAAVMLRCHLAARGCAPCSIVGVIHEHVFGEEQEIDEDEEEPERGDEGELDPQTTSNNNKAHTKHTHSQHEQLHNTATSQGIQHTALACARRDHINRLLTAVRVCVALCLRLSHVS